MPKLGDSECKRLPGLSAPLRNIQQVCITHSQRAIDYAFTIVDKMLIMSRSDSSEIEH